MKQSNDINLRNELIQTANRVFEIRHYNLQQLCKEAELSAKVLERTSSYMSIKQNISDILIELDDAKSSDSRQLFINAQVKLQSVIGNEIHKLDLELLRN